MSERLGYVFQRLLKPVDVPNTLTNISQLYMVGIENYIPVFGNVFSMDNFFKC